MAAMVAEQESDRAVLEAQWRGELRKLRNTQRHSYQQWIDEAYKEMTSSGGWGLLNMMSDITSLGGYIITGM